MEGRRDVEIPPPSEYGEALEKAWEELTVQDLSRTASDAGAEYDGDNRLMRLRFLDQKVTIDINSKRVLEESGGELPSYQSILVLHYLIGAKPVAPSGTWVTFRELDSGKFYYSAFESRSIARVIQTFGSRAELLPKAAAPLGGEPVAIGDAGVRFDVFPKLPVAIVVWRGDAELSPSANVLFDSTAGSILTTEDLVVVAGFVAGKLVKRARQLFPETA